jgi:hypothetical protein
VPVASAHPAANAAPVARSEWPAAASARPGFTDRARRAQPAPVRAYDAVGFGQNRSGRPFPIRSGVSVRRRGRFRATIPSNPTVVRSTRNQKSARASTVLDPPRADQAVRSAPPAELDEGLGFGRVPDRTKSLDLVCANSRLASGTVRQRKDSRPEGSKRLAGGSSSTRRRRPRRIRTRRPLGRGPGSAWRRRGRS